MAKNTAVGYKEKVTARRLRITLEVEVRAAEITRWDIAGHFAGREGGVPGWAVEWAARQNRLLRALLADGETGEQFLYTVIKSGLAAALDNEGLKQGLGAEEERMLERAYKTLGAEDAAYFLAAYEEGKLFEEVGLMCRGVGAVLQCARLVEVRLMKGEPGESDKGFS